MAFPCFSVSYTIALPFRNWIPPPLSGAQILAINRAVERGVISVKISMHAQVQQKIRDMMVEKYFRSVNRAHWDFVHTCFADSWKRLIEPHLVRNLRYVNFPFTENNMGWSHSRGLTFLACPTFSSSLSNFFLAVPYSSLWDSIMQSFVSVSSVILL